MTSSSSLFNQTFMSVTLIGILDYQAIFLTSIDVCPSFFIFQVQETLTSAPYFMKSLTGPSKMLHLGRLASWQAFFCSTCCPLFV